MEALEGLKNFCMNIKPVMLKVKNGEKLSGSERNQIVQFYLEVVTMNSMMAAMYPLKNN